MSSETSTNTNCEICSICCRPVTTTAADAEVDNHDEGSAQSSSSTTTTTMVTISDRCNHKACQSCLEQWYDRSDYLKRTQRKQCLFCRIDLTTDELLKLYGSTMDDINAIPDDSETSSTNIEIGTDGEMAPTETTIDEFTKHYIDTYTRQCKNCGWYVEKEDGTCDKMECLCGYRFCFQCGQETHGGGTTARLPCNCTPNFHYFYDNVRKRTAASHSLSVVVPMLAAPATNGLASSTTDITTTSSVDSNNMRTKGKTITVGQCVKTRILADGPRAKSKRRMRAVTLRDYCLEIQSNDDHPVFPPVRYGSWLFDKRGSKQGYARMKNQWNHLVNKGKTGTQENTRHRERRVYRNHAYCQDDVKAMSMRYLIPRLAYGAWLFEEGGYDKIRHNILHFWGRKRDCVTREQYLIRMKREDRRRRYEEYLNDGGNGDCIGDAQAVIKRHLNNWVLIKDPVVQDKVGCQLSLALRNGLTSRVVNKIELIIDVRKSKWNVV